MKPYSWWGGEKKSKTKIHVILKQLLFTKRRLTALEANEEKRLIMSILIKGIEMPKDGYIDIRLHTFEDGHQSATIQTGEYPFYKELDIIEVPEPHGRLIDADAVESEIIHKLCIRDETQLLPEERAIYETINNAPTVIEAEGKMNG